MKQITSELATWTDFKRLWWGIVALFAISTSTMIYTLNTQRRHLEQVVNHRSAELSSQIENMQISLKAQILRHDDFFNGKKPVPALNFTGPGVKGRWILEDEEAMFANGWTKIR